MSTVFEKKREERPCVLSKKSHFAIQFSPRLLTPPRICGILYKVHCLRDAICIGVSYAGIFRHSAKILAKASMRNTNFKKYAGLFRRPPNVANRIRLRRATSNAHVFNKISYAGLSKWSQRGGLENRLPNRHGGSNPSACAIKTNTIPRGWCLFLSRRTRGREPTSASLVLVEWGSHTPPEDRRAGSSGAGCGYLHFW